MNRVQILAPLDGWCSPLDEVPDQVFAGRMLGDGLAIDPTSGRVFAPCDGRVLAVAAGAHAVSITTGEGVEVLVHVGIDTVQLAGRGFHVRVSQGQTVSAGETLLDFDLDLVARAAKSLLSPILIVTAPGVEIVFRRMPGPVRAGEVLLEVATREPTCMTAPGDALVPAPAEAIRAMTMALTHGLHARPAALLVQRLRGCGVDVTVTAHGKTASARSAVALMSLGIRQGDELVVRAVGANQTAAQAAVTAVAAALAEAQRVELADSSTKDLGTVAVQPLTLRSASAPAPGQQDARFFAGTIAVPGIAAGRVVRIKRAEITVVEAGIGPLLESAALTQALATVRAQLTKTQWANGDLGSKIVACHLEFLDDPLLNEAARDLIQSNKSASYAWRTAIGRAVKSLRNLEDPRLRERADDLRDIETQVLLALQDTSHPTRQPTLARSVIVADELLPSELTALDREHLVAVCLAGGGATSHVAILAAAMDVPMLVGLGDGLHALSDDTLVIVDAERGHVDTAPSDVEVHATESQMLARHVQRNIDLVAAQAECRTRDGVAIAVYANLGNLADATAAVAGGAEGCGLLRTEFLFMERETAPTEAEQVVAYQAIAEAMSGRPLVLRVMDIGGDKPLKYLPLPFEANPALGLRGIRTGLWRMDLLRTQLRAALQVKPMGVVRLLLPMITDIDEIRKVRALVDELRAELGGHAVVQIGAMIETPAAALLADEILAAVEFLSIGSNDLTQYTLAMDRGHPELAKRSDALHPAVLKLIAAAAAAGVAQGKLVALCGGAAADPVVVPILIGLGIRELSVVPAAVPALKRQVRLLNLAACRAHALRCLALSSAMEVRAIANTFIDSLGVGS